MKKRRKKAPLCVSMGELSCCHAKHGSMTEGVKNPPEQLVPGGFGYMEELSDMVMVKLCCIRHFQLSRYRM